MDVAEPDRLRDSALQWASTLRAWKSSNAWRHPSRLDPTSKHLKLRSPYAVASLGRDGDDHVDVGSGEELNGKEEAIPMSRARRKRLEKTRQQREERRAEQDRVFEEFSRDVASRHPEMMDLLEDEVTPESAEELARKVEERLKAKMGDWYEERTGSDKAMSVVVREIDPFDLTLWLELEKKPTEEHLHSISSVMRAWYLLGKIGGYNAANLQFNEDIAGSLSSGTGTGYRTSAAEDMLPAAMHNIGDVELQGRILRVWVDLGTADMLALDILVNALLCFSTDHVGIKCLTIGGDSLAGWKETASGSYDVVEL